MSHCLLDTDIFSEVLKQKDSNVLAHASAYLARFGQFASSAVTRYEVVRGLKAKGATKQLGRFLVFCQRSLILEANESVFDRAADLWVAALNAGLPQNDADLIIAATALEHGRILVTGNVAHFAWVPGLTVMDWRQP